MYSVTLKDDVLFLQFQSLVHVRQAGRFYTTVISYELLYT